MTRARRLLPLVLASLLLPLVGLSPAQAVGADHYRNPLAPRVPDDGTVDSCADPTMIRGQEPGDRFWYMYCTTDPLNDADTAGGGAVVFHPVPMLRSRDLVNWTYKGDALPTAPTWAAEGAGLWAPDVVYSRTQDRWYLTFVVTNVDDAVSGAPGCEGDSAIGVATSDSPLGPWTMSDEPVVPPRKDPNNPDPCAFFWTYDPDVLGNSIADTGTLYYGSYYGGVFGTAISLTPDGMTTTGTATQVTLGNRYEGTNVVRRGGWYYLFASATDCCNGPITGYSVFAGRSRSPLGPFVDREGQPLTAGRIGGTPVISMNGNRWIGTGHNSVFRDRDGQWWTVYHAVDRGDPYFESEQGFTKRPVLLDPLDWRNGWPTVRGGQWASDSRMPAPAAQPGETSRYRPRWLADHRPGMPLSRFSDTFDGKALHPRWSWVRPPEDASTYGVRQGRFRFDVQAADLTRAETTKASVLVEDAPNRDYVVETKVRLNLPPEGCCHNYVQAGLVVYDNADRFIKLTHVSIFETRQTEFAKEVSRAFDDKHRYGNTVVGPPSTWTHLRIVRDERAGGRELYTAYTSRDGRRWVRGGTWTHRLGDNARIGLVSMGGVCERDAQGVVTTCSNTGYTARFAHVRVSRLAPSR